MHNSTTSMKLKTGMVLTGIAALALGTGTLPTPALAFPVNAKGVYTNNNPYDFQRVVTIRLSGPKGHGDSCVFDPQNSRIFCSMHDHGVDVVSAETNKEVKFISDVLSPSDEEYYDGYIYVAQGPGAGHLNALVVINANTLKIVDKVKSKGTSDDEITINPETKTLYMGEDDNDWVEVYNISDPARPTFKTIFHMVPPNAISGIDDGVVVPPLNALFWSDDSYVGRYNASTGKLEDLIDTEVPLGKFGGTKGEHYDAKTNTVWVVTTHPGSEGVLVLNAKDGTIIKALPETGGGDVIAVDPDLGLAYVFTRWYGSHGFDVYDMNKEVRIAHVNVPSGQTHSGAVDTNNHMVYAFGGNQGILVGFKPVPVQPLQAAKK